MKKHLFLFVVPVVMAVTACADTPAYQSPKVDSAVSTQKIKNLAPKKQADRTAVSKARSPKPIPTKPSARARSGSAELKSAPAAARMRSASMCASSKSPPAM